MSIHAYIIYDILTWSMTPNLPSQKTILDHSLWSKWLSSWSPSTIESTAETLSVDFLNSPCPANPNTWTILLWFLKRIKFWIRFSLLDRKNINKKLFRFCIWPCHELADQGINLSYSFFSMKSKSWIDSIFIGRCTGISIMSEWSIAVFQ